MVATTPGSSSNGASMHQKQPPAKVATACPGATFTVVAAAAPSEASVAMLTRSFLMAFISLGWGRQSVESRAVALRLPEPRRAAHAARIPVHRGQQPRAHLV